MEGLTRFPTLREEERRPENLFAALFRRGSAGGYLSDADSAGLRRALLRLVQQGADRWCGSPASSLPKEKAEILTASVLYVLGLGLEELPEEAALRCLKQLPLPEIYHRGMDRIRRKTAVCRHRALYLQGDLFQTPNVFYNDTLGPGLRGFFKLYAPEIDALHLPITADYTPCLGRPEDKGIGFMERYLDRLEPENRFLRRFAPERVDALLKSISSEYAQIPLNLFEPVFACALLLTLIGREPRELSLLSEEREVLEGEIARCREGELERLLRRALAELADMWALPGSMIRYLESCLILLLPWWKGAADRGTLDRVLLCPRPLRSVDSAAAGVGV